jgi:hypothetical protein
VTKQPGLGDNFYLDEFDISGDTGALNSIGAPMTTQDVTSINLSGFSRIGLLHDGVMDWLSFWNPSNVNGDAAHQVLRGRPIGDRLATYFRGTAVGNAAASVVTKQVNYDGTRADSGALTFQVASQANGFGLEWGVQLTPGKKTDSAAGNGATADLGSTPVSYSQGWAAYLHVFAFTGTSVTVKIQDSADGATWADLAGASFAAVAVKSAQRLAAGSSTATVRRYVRAVSSGTFTNAVYAVNFVRYEVAGHV